MNGSSFPDRSFPRSALRVIPRGSAPYELNDRNASVTVRTLEGYEAFQDWINSSGLHADEVGKSIRYFAELVRAHRVDLRENVPSESIAVFLGNTLVQMRADTEWVEFEGDFPSVGPEPHYYEPLHLLEFFWDADEETLEIGLQKTEQWAAAPVQRPTPGV